jgi:hypothetical protein
MSVEKLLFVEVWPESEFLTATNEELEIKIECEKGFLGSLDQRERAQHHLTLRGVPHVAD